MINRYEELLNGVVHDQFEIAMWNDFERYCVAVNIDKQHNFTTKQHPITTFEKKYHDVEYFFDHLEHYRMTRELDTFNPDGDIEQQMIDYYIYLHY